MAYTPGYAKDDIKLKGKEVVPSNAEKMNTADLIKIAQSNGEPLFKGVWNEDMHPRDGNGCFAESVNATAAANEASSRAKRTDNANEHARAARLHWRASRLAMNQSDADRHAAEARAHDLRATR